MILLSTHLTLFKDQIIKYNKTVYFEDDFKINEKIFIIFYQTLYYSGPQLTNCLYFNEA